MCARPFCNFKEKDKSESDPHIYDCMRFEILHHFYSLKQGVAFLIDMSYEFRCENILMSICTSDLASVAKPHISKNSKHLGEKIQ